MRRLLPTIVLLGVGLAALFWALAALEGIVVTERREAKLQLESSRETLAEYARRTLEGELEGVLHEAQPRIAEAADSPLVDAAGLVLFDGEVQRLPRRVMYREGAQTPAQALYRDIRAGQTPIDEDDPARAERLTLHRDLVTALRAGDEAAIVDTVQYMLAHRARWVLDPTLEIPALVASVDELIEHADPHPDLLRDLLREGVGDLPGQRREGLQVRLLSRRDRFSHGDFMFLAERVRAQSEHAGLETADFEARVAATEDEVVPFPRGLTGTALTDGGRRVMAPRTGWRTIGVDVDLEPLVAGVEQQMRERGLLGDEDRIELQRIGPMTAVSDLRFDVEAPDLDYASRKADANFKLKTTFVVGAGALALIIAAMALLLQRRSYRFVELKSDFVATVSHELRTPLASIRLMAETLERKVRGRPEARDYPARIVREIDELAFLVENILSFNRLDKGRWVPRRQAVGLGELVDDVLAELEAYGFAGVQLSSEGIDDLTLHADRELLKLLLRNVLKNACTYNERDPVRLSVTAMSTPDGGLVMEVTDNGVGIERSQWRRVFEDFRRGGSSRARGSGLGLSICRKSMEAHGGTIAVVRSGPEGTTFRLDFPGGIVQRP